MERLAQHIESLIFTTEQPISLKEIRSCLETVFEQKFKETDLLATLESLKSKYQVEKFAFEIVEVADGYQFLTKGDYFQTIATYLKINAKKKLSRAAMETLSLIAYKQPVTKSSMEKIRGVSCDYSVQKLLEKELITIIGRSDGPGRPLLYGTSAKFMDYMGIKNLNELPKIKDFKTPENEIGEAAPIEESENIQHTPLTDQGTPPAEANPDAATLQKEAPESPEHPNDQPEQALDVENQEAENVTEQDDSAITEEQETPESNKEAIQQDENSVSQNQETENVTEQDNPAITEEQETPVPNTETTQQDENSVSQSQEAENITEQNDPTITEEQETPVPNTETTQQDENSVSQHQEAENVTEQDDPAITEEQETPAPNVELTEQNESSAVENKEDLADNIVTPLPENSKKDSEEE